MADRFEREIEDILRRIDKFPQRKPSNRARSAVLQRLTALQQALAVRIAQLSVGQIMLAGMIAMLVGFLFRAAIPDAWQYVFLAGLALFFSAFILSFFGAGRGRSQGQYWRGRPAQSYYSSGPTLLERLRGWWRRRQSRR